MRLLESFRTVSFAAIAALVAGVIGWLPAAAQSLQAPLFDENALREFVSQQVAGNGSGLTRFEVQFGTVDARYTVTPCRHTEPFIPAGGRLWGRSSLGVRCTEGANWSLMVPVTVRAWGPALVAATQLQAGIVPSAQDVQTQEIELTREAPSVLREFGQLQGRTLGRPLMQGQALRNDMFRPTLVIQSGDPVRLRLSGAGFAITATGQAMTAASEGQTLRVRTELGKVLTGVAREGRLVDVTL